MKFLNILLFLIIISGCQTKSKYKYKRGQIEDMNPPGCIQLGSNYFMDYNEVTNMNWREYMYWEKRHFGLESIEYLQTIPDTFAFIVRLSNDTQYVGNWDVSGYYLTDPYTQDLPVVGLDLDQMKRYSDWRSDRVFEMVLIRGGYLEASVERKFSLQGLLNGQFELKRQLPEYVYYPKYRVSSIEDYNRALISTEHKGSNITCLSISDTIVIKKRQKPGHLSHNLKYNNHYKTSRLPLLKHHYVELTNEGDTISREWFDESLEKIDTANMNIPHIALCGFRNACEWVKIKVPDDSAKH